MKQLFKTILFTILCVMPLAACANTSKQADDATKKSCLVVYFSCTNTTKGIADKITTLTDADEFRIEPSVAYSSDDLDYNNSNSRANQEQNNDTARPAIAKQIKNIDNYDVIYVGFPIWWGKLPKIMYTFFDAYNLSGKTIIPFCTSGSSGINTSVNEIKSLEPDATVINGIRFASNASEATIKS